MNKGEDLAAPGKGWLITACACLSLAVAAAALSISHTPFGAAMSMDSLYYLSAAQQMALGNGIVLPNYVLGDPDVSPLTTWPPLYAAFLRFLVPGDVLFGGNAGNIVVVFNVIALISALSLFYYLGTRVSSAFPAFLATLVLALMPSMQIIYMYAWSETLFVPVLLAALCCFDLFLDPRSRHRHLWLALSVACLALGFHLRYAVLGFVAGLCTSILLFDRTGLGQRIKLIAGTVVLFVALVAPLLLRNFLLASNLVGERPASSASLPTDIHRLGQLLASEVFHGFRPLPWVLGIVAVAALAALWKRRGAGISKAASPDLPWFASIFALAYLTSLIAGRQVSLIDLDTRMVGPSVPFLMLAVLGLLSASRQVFRPVLVRAIGVLLLLVVATNGYRVHAQIMTSWQSTRTPGTVFGIAYNSISNPGLAPYFRLRELVRLPEDALILTDLNAPAILHYFFPRAQVKKLPENPAPEDLGKLGGVLARHGLVVITSDQTASTFAAATKGGVDFMQVLDANGQPMSGVLILELPISLVP